jgi:hypothetical protein
MLLRFMPPGMNPPMVLQRNVSTTLRQKAA